MRKIPTLFARDPDDLSKVTREYHPDCLWVRDGEGVATRKFDGTCIRLDDAGRWWARRETKPGKTTPGGFEPIEHDYATGKTVGWEPVEQSSFYKVFLTVVTVPNVPGTYELCGPKVNGNPEGLDTHQLIPHGVWEIEDTPRDYDRLAEWLPARSYEGIVWHHPDGRMAKIKVRDFADAGSDDPRGGGGQ